MVPDHFAYCMATTGAVCLCMQLLYLSRIRATHVQVRASIELTSKRHFNGQRQHGHYVTGTWLLCCWSGCQGGASRAKRYEGMDDFVSFRVWAMPMALLLLSVARLSCRTGNVPAALNVVDPAFLLPVRGEPSELTPAATSRTLPDSATDGDSLPGDPF